MKLKYYLRGIGTATIVIVLILSLSGGKKEGLSDAEIRERAMQLGMVDATSLTLADVQTGTEQPDTIEKAEQPVTKLEAKQETEEELVPSVSDEDVMQEEASQEAENQPEEEGVQEVLPNQEEAEQEIPTESEEETVPESSEEQESAAPQVFYEAGSTQEEPVTIVIQSGVGSYTVSRVLAEAGLVADAGEFDRYLCNIGYSKVINTGTYEIMPGTSEEEIAKIITRNR